MIAWMPGRPSETHLLVDDNVDVVLHHLDIEDDGGAPASACGAAPGRASGLGLAGAGAGSGENV